ncbi:bifunctional [glutamate--ammonia ligase]-adenylyl-L-tyrosine phosphorylase/[glutamate--ammonia-ligase] adenylyltransferase [Thalassotalea psychrophila]|uniref:Bifunctional glutamine synthetase adenylyltransferase/adenylyl-removing enzyme n=1 Tax=Thalassotalea psychrophila TaxID=3065647 RepID=A0ABY9TWD4_9GAMM|nr:bifunctional [glutamate--ammonia ligase]-adenylyl-L-tyrosine phosphorylase/[glutamate--ammonia-ligase] adenylyltransferase [Colwelliaceae bacterium SQ149]
MQDISSTSMQDILLQQQNSHFSRFAENAPEVLQTLTAKQISLLKHAFAMSDFVAEGLISKPHWVVDIIGQSSFNFSEIINVKTYIFEQIDHCKSEDELHQTLRKIRNKFLIAMAIADLCQNCALKVSLANLSHLADTLIEGALSWLSKYCQSLWGQPQNADGVEQPLLVYGMGKLGGKELNFSSDIDLIFVYPQSGETKGARRSIDNQQYFTRLGQKLIAALDQVTKDGFVYRVDMRLRPFGDSGPLVLSFAAIENYYQDQGRDWERYAMLKARIIGESPYKQQLSNLLKPFIYRRYIDFSVIESFRKMKFMIAQEARRRQLQHNIKLGEGGIREIEFIAQVFQLIRGGRVPELQQRSLLIALNLLVEYDCIEKSSKQVLLKAYYFLRRSENAIQAFNDQQTQQLPEDEKNQARLCHLLGFEQWGEYLTQCQQHMQAVNHEFSMLIGEDNEKTNSVNQHWVTLWLANWEAEESISWILKLQPDWPAEQINKQLFHFKAEVQKRSIGNRGRLVIDKLMPVIIEQLTEEPKPAITLERTLQVLAKVVTRTAYLELLYENPPAFKQLLKLCRASAWISEYLSKFPILLDELIDPKILYSIPSLSDYKIKLTEHMMRIPEDDLEAQMEGLRQFKQSKQLKIAAADITGILPVMEVSDHLTALAEAIINEVVNMAWQQMVHRYGQPNSTLGTNDKGFAVIGYGKLGGFELGYGSDLDLVFVHNRDKSDETSGVKSISASHFYLKMAQRILHLFNTRTANGTLYEADMRLRPSGNSGLMAVHIDTFEHYQKTDAWTWEHQALVRARVVYGEENLTGSFAEIRHAILTNKRNSDSLREDIIKMRTRMRDHLDSSSSDVIDIKQSIGGLADIEFLAQFFVLNNSHKYPQLTTFSDNVRIFELLQQHQLLSVEEETQLVASYCELRDTGHALVLQNLPTQMDDEQLLKEREQVSEIWNKYLGNRE